MKRVFVFTTSYPNPDNPEANIFVKDQVLALSKLDNDIIVFNVRKKPTRQLCKHINKTVMSEELGYCHVVFVDQKTIAESKLPFLNQMFFNKSMRRLYKYAIRKYGKPDLIYAHFYNAAYAAKHVSHDIPIVTLEHNGGIMEKKMSIVNKHLLKVAVHGSDRYIATTYQLRCNIEKYVPKSKGVLVVPNMINDDFHYYPYQQNYQSEFVFFSLSRLTYDKRIDLLISAFIKTFTKEDNVKLIIGGDGKEYENIRKQIIDNRRGNQIILLGRQSREEALKNYINCNCFVLPSRHETFGLVWREAMCVGRPIITTDHGGFSKYDFNKDYGLMIPVDNEEALCKALIEMKVTWDCYDLKRISDENIKKYSSLNIARKIDKIFREAMNIYEI